MFCSKNVLTVNLQNTFQVWLIPYKNGEINICYSEGCLQASWAGFSCELVRNVECQVPPKAFVIQNAFFLGCFQVIHVPITVWELWTCATLFLNFIFLLSPMSLLLCTTPRAWSVMLKKYMREVGSGQLWTTNAMCRGQNLNSAATGSLLAHDWTTHHSSLGAEILLRYICTCSQSLCRNSHIFLKNFWSA